MMMIPRGVLIGLISRKRRRAMPGWTELVESWAGARLACADIGGATLVRSFGDAANEYAQARQRGAWCDRGFRMALTITGRDRAAWLHNLTTNEVKRLGPGEGNYAFILNVKGRILFDGEVLVQPDQILLMIDRRFRAAALAHLNKYVVMEDVTVSARLADWRQIGLIGAALTKLPSSWGLGHAPALPALQSIWLTLPDRGAADAALLAFRHDFCGLPGVEIAGPADALAAVWHALEASAPSTGLAAVGFDTTECLRIEAGIPATPNEINEDVLPAETGQLERAVSFQKGCYLGQEVVERMRAHKSLGKKLVGLRLTGSAEPGAALKMDSTTVGQIASSTYSPGLGSRIGLGYLRSAQAQPGTRLALDGGDGVIEAEVVPLPFVAIK